MCKFTILLLYISWKFFKNYFKVSFRMLYYLHFRGRWLNSPSRVQNVKWDKKTPSGVPLQ